jgi:hypothetical protein
MYFNILTFKSISPGAVSTDLLINMFELIKEPNSTVQLNNINALETEDVANTVISILATPPSVLVSYFTGYLHYSYKYY